MVDREPALLGQDPGAPEPSVHDVETARVEVRSEAPARPIADPAPAAEPAAPAPARREPASRAPRASSPAPDRRAASTVHVAGFWRRLAAAAIDLAVVLPVAALITWIAAAISGVHIPRANMHGPDFWLDLLLASDPALLMALGLFTAVGCVYLFVFQVTMGRTLGMHVLRLRIIDLWGEAPSNARCAIRTAGYLAATATLMLGFLWMGFDSEKRGLHDWIAGTLVVKG